MFRAATILTLSAISPYVFANGMSVSNAEVLRAAQGPLQVKCMVMVLDENDHEVPVSKPEEGTFEITEKSAGFETAVGQYSVLIQPYLSQKEDDGTPHARIEIAINSKTQQEDSISSSVKPIVFLSGLKGELAATTGDTEDTTPLKFNGILVDCHPLN